MCMKETLNMRNWIIVILCITIVCMSIGFAFLSMQIEETNSKQATNDVSILSVTPRTPVQGGTKIPAGETNITNSGQTISFKFNLFAPTDEVSYRITIKNKGTIPAEIINLLEYPDYLNDEATAKSIYPVEVKHNNIVGKVLAPGEETELNVAAIFNYKASPKSVQVPYQITILTKSSEK